MPYNEHRRALSNRAGTAHKAIAVDTRAKAVKPRKGKGAYDRRREEDRTDRDRRHG